MRFAAVRAVALALALWSGCGAGASSSDAGADLAIPTTADLATSSNHDLASSDAATATCPATMPSGACASGGLSCNYQTTTCMCVAPEMDWACCGPTLGPACPNQQPTNGDPCCIQQSTPPMCGYACGSAVAETCLCNSMHWSCTPGGC